MKFALIGAEKAEFPIGLMCTQLGVSRSGYYAWQRRSPSERAVRTVELGGAVAAIFHETKGRYGSPRIVHVPVVPRSSSPACKYRTWDVGLRAACWTGCNSLTSRRGGQGQVLSGVRWARARLHRADAHCRNGEGLY